MTKQEQFFYDNAGFSYDPKTQSPDQGHIATAKALAAAETWLLTESGYSFGESPDPDSDESFMGDKSQEYRNQWSGKAWVSVIEDEYGTVLACLGGCYGDSKYKRVVRAELALELIPSNVTV